jgi:ABC-2 type transport system ATP-binding protein
MRNAPAFEVRNLRKVYAEPKVLANDGITFDVQPGEAFGLLGPNGAGKSTLVKQLVGLLAPTSGEIRLFGEGVVSGAERRIGRTVGYLPQSTLPLGELKVEEALRWTGMLRGLGKGGATADASELIELLQLGSIVDRQLRKLSGGQRRLTHIGMTLMGRLPVLILDEPTADIDPSMRRTIWSLIGDRARAGAAVILVTHDVAEAEHALDRVAIIDRGKVVAAGTPAELKKDLAHRTRIELVIADGSGLDTRTLASELGGDTRVRGRNVSAWVPADLALRTLEKVMSLTEPGQLEDVRLITPSLEDVYLELRGHGFEEDSDASDAEVSP